MKEVRILREAESELLEAIDFYEGEQAGLGLALEAETRKAFLAIREKPDLWPMRFKRFRKRSLSRFPFNVWYLEEENCIRILRHRSPTPKTLVLDDPQATVTFHRNVSPPQNFQAPSLRSILPLGLIGVGCGPVS